MNSKPTREGKAPKRRNGLEFAAWSKREMSSHEQGWVGFPEGSRLLPKSHHVRSRTPAEGCQLPHPLTSEAPKQNETT